MTFLKSKSEESVTFKHYKVKVKNLTGSGSSIFIQIMERSTRSSELMEFCKENNILRHYTKVYYVAQNGVAKQMNHTLMEQARSMLSNAIVEQEL